MTAKNMCRPRQFITKEWLIERIHIDPMGCWLWQLSTNNDGYARVRIQGKKTMVHRLSYELYNTRIPEGLIVRHSCDTPACCNPAHLLLGTHADNCADRDCRGRQASHIGASNGRAKLVEQDIRLIRIDGRNNQAIADHYGVSRASIRNVKKGITWSHISA